MYNSDMEKIRLRYRGKHLTPMRAIRLYCKEMCCAGDTASWRDCTFEACFLYGFRLGKKNISTPKNPKGKKPLFPNKFLKPKSFEADKQEKLI